MTTSATSQKILYKKTKSVRQAEIYGLGNKEKVNLEKEKEGKKKKKRQDIFANVYNNMVSGYQNKKIKTIEDDWHKSSQSVIRSPKTHSQITPPFSFKKQPDSFRQFAD